MTPPEDDPPPPKRRRKPPRGLEGFDTGYPDEEDAAAAPPTTSSAAPRKPIWNEASQPSGSTSSDAGAMSPALGSTSSSAGYAGDAVAASPLSAEPSVVVEPPFTPVARAEPLFEPIAVPAEPFPSTGSQPMYSSGAPAFSPASAGTMATGGYGGYTASAAQLDREEPLSSAYVGASAGDLRDAVGAKPKSKSKKSKRARTAPDVTSDDDDDLDGGRPRSRKTIIVALLALVVGLGVAALIFVGRANSAWFYLSCEPDKIVAQQGRSFPPWGESALDGKQWAAIKIPPEAECIPLETEDEAELANQFRTMLVKRASILLTAKEVTKTDEANALLEQALLHARANTDAARNARTDIQRLLGDVVYWRASLKMRDASKALLEAAKQFDAAAQQRPRHVTDASAWADYVRKVVGELEAGPSGSTQTSFPPTPPPAGEPRTPAPPGVALPVEPDKGSGSEPAQPPDAGLPTGGVLL